MTQFFPPDLRTASVVTRWGIIRTHSKDTIADHSYRVTMYAQDIAKLMHWEEREGPASFTGEYRYKAYYWLMRYALIHDLDEVFTGDTITFIKSEIVDQNRAAHFVATQMQERMPAIAAQFTEIAALPYANDIKKIVKAADWLDSLLFIIDEQHMGNAGIVKYEAHALDNLKKAWFNLPYWPGDKNRIFQLWNSEMQAVIRNHRRLD